MQSKEGVLQKKREYYQKNKEVIKENVMLNYSLKHEEKTAKMREYYAKNREKIREQQNQHRKEHPEVEQRCYQRRKELYWDKKKKSDKQYRIKNADKIKLQRAESRKTEHYKTLHANRNKRYRQTESGHNKIISSSQCRRTLEKTMLRSFSVEDWKECLTHFGGTCAYCGSTGNMTQDHFVPVLAMGEYTKNNIIPACLSCNSSKQHHNFFEWYPKQPFYSKQRETKILQYLSYDPKTKLQQLSIC